MRLVWGTVSAVTGAADGIQQLAVDLDDGSSGSAVSYVRLAGECRVEERVLLNTTAMPPVAMRATMIVLFLFTDLYALAAAAWMPLGQSGADLFGLQSLRWAAWLLLPMLAGIALGHRGFAGVAPERFRAIVLDVLLVIAALGLVRGLFG